MKKNDFKPIQKKKKPTPKKVVETETKKAKDTSVVYKPFPGPQTEFLKSNEDFVLFAGGRGSGKSLAMLALPLWFVPKAKFRALIIRKTMKDLRDLINKAKKMYNPLYSPKWKEQDKMFVFPSGATIEFNYFEQEKDADQYQGQEFDYIGIDEITQYPTPYILETLNPCLRGNPDIPKFFRLTCNPNGVGRAWVKETFIDKAPAGERIITKVDFDGEESEVTYKWFHSTVRDNKELMDQGYGRSLANIKNETLRKQWLDGDWDTSDGLAFDEFKRSTHVIAPFPIPNGWTKFRACDWGYGSMAVCLWLAVDYDGKIYVYREYTSHKEKVDVFARKLLELELDERIQMGVLDSSCWATRGDIGETIAETMMREGVSWRQSDRTKGSRVAGKMLIHSYLQGAGPSGPNLFIFDTCKELIKELESLPLDSKNPEDVDTKAQDHAYDALRYGLLSRPTNVKQDFFANRNKPIIIDPIIGY